jgi:hypothetical protein
MTQPLPAPYFSAGYTTPLTDIGSGYAAGISSLGKSVAGAIGSVMGTVNPETGQAQEGLLEQGKSAHNLIDIYHDMGLFDDKTYADLKTSGLGAQQKALGQFTGALTLKYQNQLEQQRQLAVQQEAERAAMERTRVTEAGALERQRLAAASRENVAETKKKPEDALVRNAPQQPQQQPPQPPPAGSTYIPPISITAPIPKTSLF